MVVAATCLAIDESGTSEEALWALIVLVTLLATALAPDLPCRVQVVVDRDLVLLVFICLLNDTLDHCYTFRQIIISVCSDEDV